MKCYDCDLAGRDDTTAIGVCSRCGLAVCPGHGRVGEAAVSVPRGLGMSTGVLSARKVVCGTCYAAEHSA
jgi:hypothetical protein